MNDEGRMMNKKYLCVHTDTQVEIIEIDKPNQGALTFGVGGPVAAMIVKSLCNEINELHAELARLQRIEAAAREMVEKWKRDAQSMVPDVYSSRDLHHKYFKLDNEAGGIATCAEELAAALNESELE